MRKRRREGLRDSVCVVVAIRIQALIDILECLRSEHESMIKMPEG